MSSSKNSDSLLKKYSHAIKALENNIKSYNEKDLKYKQDIGKTRLQSEHCTVNCTAMSAMNKYGLYKCCTGKAIPIRWKHTKMKSCTAISADHSREFRTSVYTHFP